MDIKPKLLPQDSRIENEAVDLDYVKFIESIKKSTGIDLAQYKEGQMKRRLTTLRVKHGYQSFDSFFKGMTQNKDLLYEFLDRMTINVSEFWRNRNRWEVLRDIILPEIIQSNKGRLKIWSAACSTGEEPYTLAMILADKGLLKNTTLIASDLDDGALEKARKGLYLERSLKDVPKDVAARHFVANGMLYAIDESLKKAVQFKKQNLLLDSFENSYDLIVCRNVMIYFTEEAKNNLYHKFAKSLRPGGYLFVGSTEQIFSPAQYDLEPTETFFYRKKA
ncbi:CheR family methyltransferase [Paenibacillus crassostreae]|uniref:protein-glutamate O-methyltransferase n=1 Tax=Paenibacillus crassostreae TaxID=1763538 RepID=A0A167DK29_9BACL|nr:protein-glutamate O-methyltransferase CheR [Paenibacillus crassostreae]AOZ91367.1 chemotaxis protein CheR [Paenibacillus crassostreae]OAB74474.1 chemotaxis protein CheR [Paenibacillus crassostreae]